MTISIEELKRCLSKDNNIKSFRCFLKNLKSSNIKIFKDNQGCEIIEVNEAIYLDFSSNVFDNFNVFDFSNITFLKKVTIYNKNNALFTFGNTKLEDCFTLFDCKETTLSFNEENAFNGKISISSSEFKSVNINSDLKGGGEIAFRKCSFKDFNISGYKKINIDNVLFLEFCIFDGKTNFMNFQFNNQISFKMSKFENNAYFNNSIFKDFADFHECEFKKNACFYNANFEKIPSFSQALFKDNLNIVNVEMLFKFEDTQAVIKEVEEVFNKEKPDNEKKPLENFANDFRDTFRIFKNTLAKEGNTLDASNYHRAELYCKEIELDLKLKKSWNCRDWIDKWQLRLYRYTSEHHTDLLRAWNSLMCLVFIFGALSFGAMAWFAYYFDDNFSLANSFNFIHLRVFYDSHIKFLIYKHPFYTWGISFGFITIFLFLFWIWIWIWISVFKNSGYIIFLGYITSIALFIISPKLLIPAIGFFTEKKEILDPLSIIGAVYTLLFGLLTYSLIKTARKNSIIPS